MAGLATALRRARAGREERVRSLTELIAFPTVSSDPRRRSDRAAAARWLSARLRAAGLSTRLAGDAGAPIVLGERLGDPRAPTVLLYAHYDVVPAEPLAAWRTPPFRATVRAGHVHGRGASDDKGPLIAQLSALETWRGSAPVNVRCVLDGQEEVGSPALRQLVRSQPRRFACDAAVISDTRMAGPRRPVIVHGLRGGLAAELRLRGLPADVHSGAFGGAVRNPAHVLCELIASLHHRDGRVAIDGFYDRVRPARPAPPGAPPDAELLAPAGGARVGFGERGRSAYERACLRPAVDVNGLVSGHTGAGPKAVVPATATAKLAFRLVPDQRPADVAALLRRHVARHTPRGVEAGIAFTKPSPPYLAPADGPAFTAAARALRASFGAEPAILRSGGTISVVSLLSRTLGVPVVMMGLAQASDAMHGPNERFAIDSLDRGTEAFVRLFHELARSGRATETVAA